MSIEAVALALNHSAATGTAKVVLIGIASHEGELGAFPAMERLASYANCTIDNVRKAVRKLEQLGELETVRNGGPQHHKPEHMRSNLYRVALRCPDYCDRTSQHRDTRKLTAQQNSRPAESRGSDSEGPRPADSRGEPSTNHQPTGNSVPTPRESRGDDRETDPADVVDEYAAWSLGQKIAEAARRAAEAEAQHKPIKRPDLSRGSGSRSMVPPAPKPPKFDPASVPPPQPPRSPEDDAAVAALHTQPSDHPHLIPATSTICLRCGTDARTLTRKATP